MAKTYLASQRNQLHELEYWAYMHKECNAHIKEAFPSEMHPEFTIVLTGDLTSDAAEHLWNLGYVIRYIRAIPYDADGNKMLLRLSVRKTRENV